MLIGFDFSQFLISGLFIEWGAFLVLMRFKYKDGGEDDVDHLVNDLGRYLGFANFGRNPYWSISILLF